MNGQDTAIAGALAGLDRAKIVAASARMHGTGRGDETNPEAARTIARDLARFLPADVDAEDADSLSQRPEFLELVKEWAELRFDAVTRGLEETAGRQTAIPVRRRMTAGAGWFETLGIAEGDEIPAATFGMRWSGEDGNPRTHVVNGAHGAELLVEAEIGIADIDLEATVLARMDRLDGDDEGEIRAKPGASVTFVSCRPCSNPRESETAHACAA